MNGASPTLLALCGSLRQGSYNRTLLEHLAGRSAPS
jgi:NAD(P)H-dependent FMN reductase